MTRKLQQMLLPTAEELQQITDLDIACYMEPADEVGGDYYDILQHNGLIKIGIGDVTGHGLESGVMMVMTQAIVRALLVNGETDPVRFLATLNRALYGNVQRMGTDKNLTLALLDYTAGDLRLSGQHEAMLVVRGDGTVEVVDTIDLGFPVALMDEIADFIHLTTVRSVFAVADPEPHLRMLDRYLVTAELNELDVIVVANKCDLRSPGEAHALFALYQRIGYHVLYTSAARSDGVDTLRAGLEGNISALSGPSGVGKSSLLNAVQPGLALRTGSVTAAGANAGKGRHTTVAAELLPLGSPDAPSGYVVDTPGIRELGLWQVPPAELDRGFREFQPLVDACFFQPCSHLHEPDCAVREAVARGEIDQARYTSYARLREELAAVPSYR